MENLQRVEVLVPKERLADLYKLVSEWLEGKPESSTTINSAHFLHFRKSSVVDEVELPTRSWNDGSDSERRRDAVEVYARITTRARKIVDYLLDHPGRRFSAGKLAKALDFPSSASFTGTLASIGSRSRSQEREMPIRYESGEDGGQYWMENSTAELLLHARRDYREAMSRARRRRALEAELQVLIDRRNSLVHEQIDGPLFLSHEELDTLGRQIEEIQKELESPRGQRGLPVPPERGSDESM